MNKRQLEGRQSSHRIRDEAIMEEREIFRKKLRDFPNLFHKKDYSELTLKRQQDILDKLCLSRETGDQHCTPAENTVTSNLIAFLLFMRKDCDKAVKEIDEVLKSPNNSTNIVTLAHMAIIKWEMGNREEGEKLVRKLEELHKQENFQEKVLEAKAEIAYCYSRMGMIYAQLALDMFEEVVKARPLDYNLKYYLAFVLRRFTHPNYRMYFQMSSELTRQQSLRAFDLFLEIKNSDNPDTLRADALVELGTLLKYAKSPEFEDVNVKARQLGITAEHCYEEAVELAPTDAHVLTYSGKFYKKNRNQLDRSRELLERAIAIRPTTIAHHYLGATFTKMATQEKCQSRQNWRDRAGGRHYGNGRGSNSSSWRQNMGSTWDRPPLRERHNEGGRQHDEERLFRKTYFDQCQSGTGNCSSALEKNFLHLTVRDEDSQTDFTQRSPSASAREYTLKWEVRPGSLHLDHEYVQAAMYHFQQAIEVSHGNNSPAIYDLGVLYVRVGDDDQALNQFSTLLNQTESRGSPMQLISAYEQAGLIYMRKKTKAKNEKQRQECIAEGCRLLQVALQMQCQIIWPLLTRPTFYDLCCVASGMKSPEHQLKELAKLFEMIKVFSDYLNFLTNISVFRPQDTSDPKILEKRLKKYVECGHLNDALLFVSLLEATEEEELVNQWADPELPRRIRVMAAREKLLTLTDTPSASIDDMIKKCFLQAIQTRSYLSSEETQRQYLEDGCSELQDEKRWHVMILHDQNDDDMKVKGLTIKGILQNVCGLRVTCMSDEDSDYSDDSGNVILMNKARKSHILLLLCGPNEFPDEFLINVVAVFSQVRVADDSKPKALLALVIDNAQRPNIRFLDRWFQCPPSLFGAFDLLSPELINDICNLFCFLADITVDSK